MNAPLPPPIPSQRPPDWWTRNWKWAVPLICLVGLSAIGGCAALVFGVIRSSDAFVGAVARVKADAAVVEKLGSPLREGYLVSGQINTNGASGKANLVIPIRGTRESATIYAQETKTLGEWHFDYLIVQIDRTGERIDLLQGKESNPSSAPTRP